MEELTIEQKAQRYDEALNRAKNTIEVNQTIPDIVECVESLFPELAESDDEKIRKGIITYLSTVEDKELIPYENWIAWLEKQSKQKPADSAEPKFKVGDWIVYKDTVWKVCNISLLNYYELLKINNEVSTRTIEDVDKTAHLWAFKDAKDGDVLVNNDACYIVLFKRFSYSENGIDRFKSCCHCCEGVFSSIEYTGWCCNGFHPATKEQRDLLFQKMREAGYGWDTEKKELKKIESYSLRSIIKDKPSPAIKKVVDSLTAWNKEDENRINRLIAYFEDKESFTAEDDIVYANWLKFLKDRYIWKPSDEQMDALDYYANSLCTYSDRQDDLRSLFNVLKKL